MPEKKKTTPKKRVTKTAASKAEAAKKKEKAANGDGYFYAVGRRKRAVATVKLWLAGKGEAKVNEKAYAAYFPVGELADAVTAPLKAVGLDGKADLSIRVSGGGPRGQAEAARMGVARALLKANPDYRGSLKPLGYLTRDPREKERKKPGLRKARRAPQWSKR